MKFTLTYEGELRTSQRGRKQQLPPLRRHFHKQFKRLWDVNPFLKLWGVRTESYGEIMWRELLPLIMPEIKGIRSVPIVFSELHVECALEFRILRSTESIGNTPDIDNQLKALIDALKIPQDGNDLGHPSDFADMNPFFCLAEDDKLITRISSISDEMLYPVPGAPNFDPKQCRVLIDVYVRPIIPTADNFIFFSDNSNVWDHRYDDQIPTSLNSLTSQQLKAAATQCIFRIHALAKALEGHSMVPHRLLSADEDSSREGWEDIGRKLLEEQDTRKKIWQTTLWPKSSALKAELLRRVYGEPPYPQDRKSSGAIDDGSLAGPSPLAEAAADLDRLVRMVP